MVAKLYAQAATMLPGSSPDGSESSGLNTAEIFVNGRDIGESDSSAYSKSTRLLGTNRYVKPACDMGILKIVRNVRSAMSMIRK